MNKDFYIYQDTSTGIDYIYDGKRLVPLNDTSNIDLSKTDEETLKKEEEERQQQIEKEIEELGEMEPGSESAKSKLEDISDLFADEELSKALIDETERHVSKDRKKRQAEKKAAEEAASKYSATKGIQDFVLDINRLIAKEVRASRSTSWNKINKKYSTTKIIKPGYKEKENKHIPKLFVYFDQSGSWDSSDIEIGKQAIETLKVYEEKDQLKIELYYFANNIHTDASSASYEGGTRAGKKLIEHIKENRPDNVLIMTDSDFDWYMGRNDDSDISTESPVVITGGAFLLFRKGSISRGLVDRVKGKKLTRIYKF